MTGFDWIVVCVFVAIVVQIATDPNRFDRKDKK
jgi:hypothetical protein